MQAVSDDGMAIALATEGGLSFVYGSQTIEDQAAMVARVKDYKAGFVTSDANLSPEMTLADVVALKEEHGHSTMPVTADGSAHGKLVGVVTDRDYRLSRMSMDAKVADFMTPREKMIVAPADTSLKVANDIMLDAHKRYMVGAGINTRDYAERVPALVEAGADVLCIDSSEGYSDWQKFTIEWIREHYGDDVKVGAGNVVDAEKGIGRGQATATIEVAKARDEYFEETGVYIPICSDGGIVYDHHLTLALAMGSDFVMLGRYFARFDESPTNKVNINGSYMKEYWGEGSARARNWQRYDLGGDKKGMSFEEGVDSYVPYAGSLKDNVDLTLSKVKSTMCNCGALTIPELQEKAKLTIVSSTSIVEGGAPDAWNTHWKRRPDERAAFFLRAERDGGFEGARARWAVRGGSARESRWERAQLRCSGASRTGVRTGREGA